MADDSLREIQMKAHEQFEKQLVFITSGALALSIGFIKDIVSPFEKTTHRDFLFNGWIFLVLALVFNCISHLHTSMYLTRQAREPDSANGGEKDKEYNYINEVVNIITVFLMLAGILAITTFVILNLKHK